ncbi:MAG: hypothetical protein KME23_25385 [Goleter apudmare HA4340-LM2]|nr:hypothetical protein [Goleter apudmare HA4340-LM2]
MSDYRSMGNGAALRSVARFVASGVMGSLSPSQLLGLTQELRNNEPQRRSEKSERRLPL